MTLSNNRNEGIVYVVSNAAMDGIVKIGVSKKDNVSNRIKSLFNTSVPVPFVCEYSAKVDEAFKVESVLHKVLQVYRINQSREFFKIEAGIVIDLLKLIENKETIKNDNKKLLLKSTINRKTFDKLVGKIIYSKNTNLYAEILGPNQILYFGRLYKFSRFIKMLMYEQFDLNYWEVGDEKLINFVDKYEEL